MRFILSVRCQLFIQLPTYGCIRKFNVVICYCTVTRAKIRFAHLSVLTFTIRQGKIPPIWPENLYSYL
jgi:hypothetical protein